MYFIELIEKALGRKAEYDFMPMQPGDVRETYADISAIENDFGFIPQTSITEGIPKFIAWFREYNGI
jgi:UDP-glucuronate 4-epimerase